MAAPAFRSAGTNVVSVTAGGDITPGAPAGAADGDILILFAAGRVDDDNTQHFEITLNGTGWTSIIEHYVDIGTTALVGRAWWYRVSGSPPTMPSLDHPSANFGGIGARICAYSGCIASGSPIEDPDSIASTVSTGDPWEGVAVTTTGTDRLVVQNWYADDDIVGDPDTGWAEDSEVTGTVTIPRCFATDSKTQATAATVTAPTRTNGNERNVCIGFALIPVASGASASLASTEEEDTLSAAAQVKLTATLASTEAEDTLSSSAKVAIAASLASTEEDDTLSASATVYTLTNTTLASTEEDDTLSAAAAVKITSTLASTEVDDTLSSTAKVAIATSLVSTEADDTLSANATVASNEATSSLAVTEADDTLSASAAVRVSSSLASTEADDTLSSTAKVAIASSLASTEEADTLSAAAQVKVTASLSVTEDDDTLSSAASVTVTGLLAATEENDTLSASAQVQVIASLNASEDDDTLSAEASAALALVEQGGHFYPVKKRKPSRKVEEETEERLALESAIDEIFDRMNGLTPEVQEEIKAIVPVVKRKAKAPKVDYEALVSDIQAVKRLMEIHTRIVAEATEEEEIFLLMTMVA